MHTKLHAQQWLKWLQQPSRQLPCLSWTMLMPEIISILHWHRTLCVLRHRTPRLMFSMKWPSWDSRITRLSSIVSQPLRIQPFRWVETHFPSPEILWLKITTSSHAKHITSNIWVLSLSLTPLHWSSAWLFPSLSAHHLVLKATLFIHWRPSSQTARASGASSAMWHRLVISRLPTHLHLSTPPPPRSSILNSLAPMMLTSRPYMRYATTPPVPMRERQQPLKSSQTVALSQSWWHSRLISTTFLVSLGASFSRTTAAQMLSLDSRNWLTTTPTFSLFRDWRTPQTLSSNRLLLYWALLPTLRLMQAKWMASFR